MIGTAGSNDTSVFSPKNAANAARARVAGQGSVVRDTRVRDPRARRGERREDTQRGGVTRRITLRLQRSATVPLAAPSGSPARRPPIPRVPAQSRIECADRARNRHATLTICANDGDEIAERYRRNCRGGRPHKRPGMHRIGSHEERRGSRRALREASAGEQRAIYTSHPERSGRDSGAQSKDRGGGCGKSGAVASGEHR